MPPLPASSPVRMMRRQPLPRAPAVKSFARQCSRVVHKCEQNTSQGVTLLKVLLRIASYGCETARNRARYWGVNILNALHGLRGSGMVNHCPDSKEGIFPTYAPYALRTPYTRARNKCALIAPIV